MKLFFYEISKLLRSKIIIISGVTLFIVNICLSVVNTVKIAKYNIIPADILDDLYIQYSGFPDEVDDLYLEWSEQWERYSVLASDYYKHTEEYETEPVAPLPVFTSNGNPDDRKIWEKLFSDVNRQREYDGQINDVVERAERTMEYYDYSGVPEDSYIYRYQRTVAEKYGYLRHAAYIGFENTRGWDLYFSSYTPVLMAFAAVVMCAGQPFISEKSTGFYPIGHATPNGRVKHGVAKFFAGLAYTFTITVLMLGTNFAVIGVTIGYGNLLNGIQSYQIFTYTPLDVTVIELLLLDTLVKLLAVVTLYSLIQLVSVIFSDMIVSYFSGISIIGISFCAWFFSKNSVNGLFHQLNLISLGRTNVLFSRYRGLNIFGFCADMSAFVVSAALAVSVASAIGTVLLYSSGRLGILHLRLTDSLSGSAKSTEKIAANYGCKRKNSILNYEFYKLYGNRISAVLIPLLIIGSLVVSDIVFQNNVSYTEEKRQEYISSVLFGEISDDKFRFIENEGNRIQTALEDYPIMIEKYKNDEITIDDYYAYIQEYYYAKSHSDAYKLIKEYSSYLSNVSESNDIKCWFINEDGWNRLFFAGADYFLLAFLLLISCYIWKIERSSNISKGAFLQIMLPSKNGRGQTAKNKFIAVICSSFAACLFSICLRLCLIAIRFGFAGFDAPLLSLRSFEGASSEMTVGGYLFIYVSSTTVYIQSFNPSLLFQRIDNYHSGTLSHFALSSVLLPLWFDPSFSPEFC